MAIFSTPSSRSSLSRWRVYYFVVLPVNALMKRFEKQALPDKKKCPECQSDIPLGARRCAFCISALAQN